MVYTLVIVVVVAASHGFACYYALFVLFVCSQKDGLSAFDYYLVRKRNPKEPK
jgi:hypothetical protein